MGRLLIIHEDGGRNALAAPLGCAKVGIGVELALVARHASGETPPVGVRCDTSEGLLVLQKHVPVLCRFMEERAERDTPLRLKALPDAVLISRIVFVAALTPAVPHGACPGLC